MNKSIAYLTVTFDLTSKIDDMFDAIDFYDTPVLALCFYFK